MAKTLYRRYYRHNLPIFFNQNNRNSRNSSVPKIMSVLPTKPLDTTASWSKPLCSGCVSVFQRTL